MSSVIRPDSGEKKMPTKVEVKEQRDTVEKRQKSDNNEEK